MASPTLHKAKPEETQMFRSFIRLAMTVAAITPAATGNRASRPRAIRAPADTPPASQKKARPSDLAENGKAQLPRDEIGDADRNGEPDRADPRRRGIGVSSGGTSRVRFHTI